MNNKFLVLRRLMDVECEISSKRSVESQNWKIASLLLQTKLLQTKLFEEKISSNFEDIFACNNKQVSIILKLLRFQISYLSPNDAPIHFSLNDVWQASTFSPAIMMDFWLMFLHILFCFVCTIVLFLVLNTRRCIYRYATIGEFSSNCNNRKNFGRVD